MKDILLKSTQITKLWLVEIIANIVFLIGGFLLPWVAGVAVAAVVLSYKGVVFIFNILLLLEIKKRRDCKMGKEKQTESEAFLELGSLQNKILIITIFEGLFPIVSLVFKILYWLESETLKKKEFLINP